MQRKATFVILIVASVLAILFPFVSLRASGGSQCMMVVTYSEMAASQFKKAIKAESIEAAKEFVKKGMNQSKQAASYAPMCNCIKAENYALDAYTFSKKGYEATSLEEMKKQVKKAMDLSLDAMMEAQKCNQ